MAYNTLLADRIREWLVQHTALPIEEKIMFSGVVFMVDGKMCVNVSGDKLMLRVDPLLENTIAEKPHTEQMVMRGKTMKGYWYVEPEGFRKQADFDYWLGLCLDYNPKATASKKKTKQ